MTDTKRTWPPITIIPLDDAAKAHHLKIGLAALESLIAGEQKKIAGLTNLRDALREHGVDTVAHQSAVWRLGYEVLDHEYDDGGSTLARYDYLAEEAATAERSLGLLLGENLIVTGGDITSDDHPEPAIIGRASARGVAAQYGISAGTVSP
jgi:hypothetical protein